MSTPSIQRNNLIDYIVALLLLNAILLLVSPQSRADSDSTGQTPATIVTGTIDVIMTRLRTDTTQMQGNPEELHALVSKVVLPHLDIPGISRIVLGKASRQAGKATMSRFSDEFRNLLIRTYASSLGRFSGEATSFPVQQKLLGNNKASVNMKIQRPGQATIAMDFRMHNKSGPWLIYDIKIEGISLIANYRTEFANIVRNQGLEALINRLHSKNSGVQIAVK
ncbi:MAG: ABC transporter substrate-binding protein [Gammaproteobacteria bacterium]|nr:MAG: ABC transporter substrate-binding protein [Gammaproteobacteria bacterium]